MSSRNRKCGTAFRVTTVAAVVGLSGILGQGSAAAQRPPSIDPGKLPSNGTPAPPEKTKQSTLCFDTQKSSAGPEVPPAERDLDFRAAWQFTRGAGQKVAVIDTGVARHPRLPGLVAGGDYVSDKDGTEDCDVHGTVVAGLIAATAVDGQGFSGVAPDAQIISIRQTSEAYEADKGKQDENDDEKTSKGYGNVNTLASAVRHAADMGATVINISEVACSSSPFHDEALGAAVQYATLQKNVVIVAAAGNNDVCKAGNPGLDPLHPNADKWDRVTTYVTPAWYNDYVLSVGSVDANGAPSKFTVPGPWVDVAAPGENITSLDPRGSGLASGRMDDKGGTEPFNGTSFASPLVAGTVALVRSRYPDLSAQEVIKRVETTAHAPAEGWNPYVGYGTIDPYAAVTAELAPGEMPSSKPHSRQLAIPAAPAAPDHSARNTALIGSAILAVLLVLGVLSSFPLRRRMQQREAQNKQR